MEKEVVGSADGSGEALYPSGKLRGGGRLASPARIHDGGDVALHRIGRGGTVGTTQKHLGAWSERRLAHGRSGGAGEARSRRHTSALVESYIPRNWGSLLATRKA